MRQGAGGRESSELRESDELVTAVAVGYPLRFPSFVHPRAGFTHR